MNEQPSNISAFTKIPERVESHESIPNAISEPVKVVTIDSNGAKVADGLPPGRVMIYDVTEYEEVEEEIYTSTGYREFQDGEWIKVYDREVVTYQVPKTVTYAVLVGDDEGI